MLVVIDYGMGNVGSILNMLKVIRTKAVVTSDYREIEQANKLILPGVGAFDKAITNLKALGIIPLLNQKVVDQKTPILGICLGLQLFAKNSEEGELPGLSWIDAEVKKFRFKTDQSNLKIPHMGWNLVKLPVDMDLFSGLGKEEHFYFAHSFYVDVADRQAKIAYTDYGFDMSASVQKANIYGVQFHPEKSGKAGLKILQNFAEICRRGNA